MRPLLETRLNAGRRPATAYARSTVLTDQFVNALFSATYIDRALASALLL